ncbi:MAG TPA: hypothetical protein VJ583_04205 [Nitrososphaeraceae archaeon]|nr:hypothetical protein [Nitrososphaeraceae archaeon]
MTPIVLWFLFRELWYNNVIVKIANNITLLKYIIMSTKKNNDIVGKRQEDIDAKENNEIKETLNTVSYKDLKESKKRG